MSLKKTLNMHFIFFIAIFRDEKMEIMQVIEMFILRKLLRFFLTHLQTALET